MKKTKHGFSVGLALVSWGLTGILAMGAEWMGTTPTFRVDGRADSGVVLDVREEEWATWDAAWTEGAERVEVSLERPNGTVETLGGGNGSGERGSAEWMPREDEWGTFTLRFAAWNGEGTLLEKLTAWRVLRTPAERAYAAWVAARGGTMESLPMNEDKDGDGASNWEEYVADTNPWDDAEVLKSRLVIADGGVVRIEPSIVRTERVYGVNVWRNLTGTPEYKDLGAGHEGIGFDLNGEGETIGFGSVSVSVPNNE